MKKTLFLFAFVSILSCSEISTDDSMYLPPISKDGESTTIPLNEALASLDDMLSEIAASTKSCDAKCYSSSDVSVIGSTKLPMTKSVPVDIPDTLMYFVNFEGNDGFAVMAGDRRLGAEVYCVTEDGSISLDDFIAAFNYLSTPSVESKVSGSEEYFQDLGQTFVPALMLSSMLADLKYGLPIDENHQTKTPVATDASVLLKTKWHQDSPFNDLMPMVGTEKCPAGCVAIACAQIMQYCKKPASPSFNGIPCSWDTMGKVCRYDDLNGYSAEGATQVAAFLKHIGHRSLCYIRYDIKGSGGYADGVVRTLKHYGYSNVKKVTGFGNTNQAKASKMLSRGLPVYLDGSDYHHGGGHAWVIDGEWNGYFHCNWGWHGIADGYFAKHNYFPLKSRRYVDTVDPDVNVSANDNTCFDWNFRMITYSL